ncbi:MAG: Peptide deformylase [Candidatus Azambacteria bacterium GW2011_GWA2_42_62]|nr:MAG: Peptide deformylase [Candidatus Azambacteria bacterium GW2011_GWA2_42_62]
MQTEVDTLWEYYPPKAEKNMAKILKIIQEKNLILRKKAEPVKDPNSAEIKELIADMIATMKDANGIGLAEGVFRSKKFGGRLYGLKN